MKKLHYRNCLTVEELSLKWLRSIHPFHAYTHPSTHANPSILVVSVCPSVQTFSLSYFVSLKSLEKEDSSHSFLFDWKEYIFNHKNLYLFPLASKRSREVANLTERKNLHTPIYGVKEFVCLFICLSVYLSVCLSIRYKRWPQLSRDWKNRISWNLFRTSLAKWMFSNFFIYTVFLDWSQIFNTKITTQTCTIHRGYEICKTNFPTT